MKKGEEKSLERKNQLMAERISASDIPFYQRIIQKDQDNNTKKWNSNQRRQEIYFKLAGSKAPTVEELARQDEIRAQKEAEQWAENYDRNL